MQYLLSNTARAMLTRLSRERTLYAFDFDGTLSPIVDHPSLAGMPVRTRSLLSRLAALRPCVVISGRARPDLLDRLGGVKVSRAIGNHGAETDTVSRTRSSRVTGWQRSLELALHSLEGVWVENKGLSLAVHYRQAPDGEDAERRILGATGRLEGARVFGGKMVVNLLLEGTPDKGRALAAERQRLGCDWVLYVGDDENDEDAFALKGNVVGVRIGRNEKSHARYYLRDQAEIESLLEILVSDARSRDPIPGGAPLTKMA